MVLEYMGFGTVATFREVYWDIQIHYNFYLSETFIMYAMWTEVDMYDSCFARFGKQGKEFCIGSTASQ